MPSRRPPSQRDPAYALHRLSGTVTQILTGAKVKNATPPTRPPAVTPTRDAVLIWAGTYDPARTYLPQQVIVTATGAVYMALAVNVGIDPPTDVTTWLPFGGGASGTPPAYALPGATIYDDFTRSDRNLPGDTLPSGQTYPAVPDRSSGSDSTPGITSNQGGTRTSTATGGYCWLPITAAADGRIKVTYVAGNQFIFMRYTNVTNTWYGRWNGLYKMVAGTPTQVIAWSLSPGDIVEVSMSGSTIKGYINGAQVGSTITDTFNATAVKVGVVTYDGDPTQVLDDWSWSPTP